MKYLPQYKQIQWKAEHKLKRAEHLLYYVENVLEELGQPLTVVIGLSDLLLAKVNPDDPIAADLALIANHARLMEEIIKGINHVNHYNTNP